MQAVGSKARKKLVSEHPPFLSNVNPACMQAVGSKARKKLVSELQLQQRHYIMDTTVKELDRKLGDDTGKVGVGDDPGRLCLGHGTGSIRRAAGLFPSWGKTPPERWSSCHGG